MDNRKPVSRKYSVACEVRVNLNYDKVNQIAHVRKARGSLEAKNMAVSQWYGHPRVLGIPIPISLAFWASPVGDAQNADRFDFAKIISDWGKVGIVNFEFTAEYSAEKNP